MPDVHTQLDVCQQRFSELTRRLEQAEKSEWRTEIATVSGQVTDLSIRFAKLDGKILGAVGTSTVLGGVIFALVQMFLKH